MDRAGKTMQEIVASVRRMSAIVGEISGATQEQANGVSQVGDAVGQMDQVTQQNATLVEESAAAADCLRKQAQQLVGVVSVVKMDGQSELAGPPAAGSVEPVRAAGAQQSLTGTLSRPKGTPAIVAQRKAAELFSTRRAETEAKGSQRASF